VISLYNYYLVGIVSSDVINHRILCPATRATFDYFTKHTHDTSAIANLKLICLCAMLVVFWFRVLCNLTPVVCYLVVLRVSPLAVRQCNFVVCNPPLTTTTNFRPFTPPWRRPWSPLLMSFANLSNGVETLRVQCPN